MWSLGHTLAGRALSDTLATVPSRVGWHPWHHANLVTDHRAPPLGATLVQAHGRGGVVKRLASDVAHVGPDGGAANQNSRLLTNAVYELTPPAVWRHPLEAKGFRPFKGYLITHDVIASSR